MAAGLAVRLAHVLPAAFPLNDGGMFYMMAEDVQRAHYLLPEHTSYNGLDIPFAYPPVAFFLASWLDAVGSWSLLDVVRFLPLVASTLTIPVFYLLARAMLSSRSAAMIAVLAFAVLPRGFNWEIVGGGLTRSVGMLFALLALHQGFLLFRNADHRRILPTAFLGSLALMSHPETGWLVAFSLPMFFLAHDRSRRGLAYGLAVAAAMSLLSAPWWGTVVARHGLGPLLSAAQSGRGDWYSWAGDSLLSLDFTEEPFLPVLAGLGMVGLVISVARGGLLLPVWLAAMFLLDPRKASTHAMIPLAMLIGIAVASAILPLLSRESPAVRLRVGLQGVWALAAVIALLAYGSLAAVGTASVDSSPLHALSEESRQAIGWVARGTPEDSRFLVIKGAGSPWTDSLSEWFPALTKRASLGTVQGYEWLGKSRYERQQDRYDQLQACAGRSVRCLEKWALQENTSFSHVYVARPPDGDRDCCSVLRRSLRASPRYVVLYDGPGATIFGRRASLDG
jgi:hypothetical protein